MAKGIVNIRLRPDQEEKINAIVERSAILGTSKFVRIAVDWLLMSDLGKVISKIVNPQTFSDYAIPKKTSGRKQRRRRPHKGRPKVAAISRMKYLTHPGKPAEGAS